MSALPLPHKSVNLSPAGFKKLYESVRTNQVAATTMAEEIEANPRNVLEHLFKLTKKQQTAIDNTSDDDLRHRARVLLAELRSEAPNALQFLPVDPQEAHKGTGREYGWTCTCLFVAPAPKT